MNENFLKINFCIYNHKLDEFTSLGWISNGNPTTMFYNDFKTVNSVFNSQKQKNTEYSAQIYSLFELYKIKNSNNMRPNNIQNLFNNLEK